MVTATLSAPNRVVDDDELLTQRHGEVPIKVVDVTSLGGGVELIRAKREEFSWELADRVLALTPLLAADRCIERQLSDWHVTYLGMLMKRHDFHCEWVNLISAYCKETGLTYRINGQHTCWARKNHDIDWHDKQPVSQVMTLHYEAKTFEDVRHLYASYDSNRPRTRSHKTNALLIGNDPFVGVSPRLLGKLASGFGFWLWESHTERARHDVHEVAYLLRTDHADMMRSLGVFGSSSPALIGFKFLTRTAVVAAMCATFNKVRSDSEVFWGALRSGAGMNLGDPRLKLRNHLMSHGVAGSGVRTDFDKDMDSEKMFRGCLVAWNAFREGKQLRNIVVRMDKPRPRVR